jgi:hypothetical protein
VLDQRSLTGTIAHVLAVELQDDHLQLVDGTGGLAGQLRV